MEQEQPLKQKQQEGEPVHLLNQLRKRLILKKEKKRTLLEKLGFMCHLFCISKHRTKMDYHYPWFRKAQELRKAGIWFQESETRRLTDVSFSRTFFMGKLWLPRIMVDDSTGTRFMNLITYKYELIDDAGDVKLLRDHGLFHDVLGSDEEVAKLFNTMSTVLVPSPEIYLDLKLQIEDHCRKKWIRHAAQAYLAYFSSPWTILAFLGANAALLMSALQTYYAIISAK
ncbi:putative UPF0481 protein At3g02645 [Hibiscus syriacus]|uniref:putative UPF0481 protein At3g02645 n=1 Tax=Hibiscus syriacus TaxID=106335 RepID=UPI0019244453|nr:putative UPF0481 protein At3g02645 [Hibiscus syriacus]